MRIFFLSDPLAGQGLNARLDVAGFAAWRLLEQHDPRGDRPSSEWDDQVVEELEMSETDVEQAERENQNVKSEDWEQRQDSSFQGGARAMHQVTRVRTQSFPTQRPPARPHHG